MTTALSFVVVVAYAWALWESRLFRIRTGLFPWVIGFPVLALALVQLILLIIRKEGIDPREEELPKSLVNRRTASVFIWIIGFFVAIWLLGFNIAAPLCTCFYLLVGREKWSDQSHFNGDHVGFCLRLFLSHHACPLSSRVTLSIAKVAPEIVESRRGFRGRAARHEVNWVARA